MQQVAAEAGLTIRVFVPADAQLMAQDPAKPGERYLHKDGDYSICTRKLLGTTAEGVIGQITGISAEELTILETQRFGLPEYRFSWYEDGLCCRGDVIQDGELFYAVVVSIQEELGGEYGNLAAQVFSSIGLNGTEV